MKTEAEFFLSLNSEWPENIRSIWIIKFFVLIQLMSVLLAD